MLVESEPTSERGCADSTETSGSFRLGDERKNHGQAEMTYFCLRKKHLPFLRSITVQLGAEEPGIKAEVLRDRLDSRTLEDGQI